MDVKAIEEFKATLGFELPGQGAIVGFLHYGETVRTTMDKEILKGWDSLGLKMGQDFYEVWRGLMVTFGILKT